MTNRRNIVLLTEFDGTHYTGWQSQKSTPTIQETIRNAILKITGEEVVLYGCSRTDAGVHAHGHMSNFFSETRIPISRLPIALNSTLPSDISILKAAFAPKDFHARFSSIGKKYCYRIHNNPSRPALGRDRFYHIPKPLDLDQMRKAAGYFCGEHDFSGFMSKKSIVKTTVREIYEIVISKKCSLIEIFICGNGFLTHMVRIICGSLVDVGLGRISPENICDIMESKDRRKAGKTLPGHGLYLEEVYYPEPPFSDFNT
jgi:tRNA pseudouridine38-40 synthase